MNPCDSAYIEQISGQNLDQRQALINYYNQAPESIRVYIHSLQTDILRKLRSHSHKNKRPEYTYACLLLAVHDLKNREKSLSKKRNLTSDDAHELTQLRVHTIKAEKGKRKKSPTKKLVETRYLEEIKNLRQEGLSWRDVSRYIRKYHRRKISHSYLQQICKQLLDEQEK